jgi:hypothetical protein
MSTQPPIALFALRFVRCLPVFAAATSIMACCSNVAPVPPAPPQKNDTVQSPPQKNAAAQARSSGNEPGEKTQAKEEEKRPTPAEEVWAIAGKEPARIGDIEVRVISIEADFMRGKDAFGDITSKEKVLVIRIEIDNLSDTKKIDYLGWVRDRLLVDRATLKDDLGNIYRPVSFGGFGIRIEGQHPDGGSIYPSKSISDVLMFELPVEKANVLKLELPAEHLHEKGAFRLSIAQGFRLGYWRAK